jgi:hypothetical protein
MLTEHLVKKGCGILQNSAPPALLIATASRRVGVDIEWDGEVGEVFESKGKEQTKFGLTVAVITLHGSE